MAGEDSLQVLCMAASLPRRLLEDIQEKGGQLLFAADGSPYPIAAVFGRVGRADDIL
jgi:hypothetical protein